MTLSEFQKRLVEVDKARRIFNNLTDDNITKSFAAYQEILASEKMDELISSKSIPINPLHNSTRRGCPECGASMDLHLRVPDENGNVWPTAWVCRACFSTFYNEADLPAIIEETLNARSSEK